MVWFVNRMAGLGKGLVTQARPALSVPIVCVEWASWWADCSQASGPVWSSCEKPGTKPKDGKLGGLRCLSLFGTSVAEHFPLLCHLGKSWLLGDIERKPTCSSSRGLCCVNDASVGGREPSLLLPCLCLVGRLFCSALFPGMQVITVWVLIVSNCYWVVVILAYGKWKCNNSKSFTVIRHS